jgi:hypothetical protein
MSDTRTVLPTLTVNGSFLQEFVSAAVPGFALGMVEEGKRTCGFVALHLDRVVPREVLNRGFRFGHQLLGNDRFEVVHFAFEFYGFPTYHALLNPHHPLACAVLTAMVESGDYFFFALDSEHSTTAFRSELGEGNLQSLRDYLPRLRRSTTTDPQYERAVVAFQKTPEPPGVLLRWVCRNDEYLDLTEDRLDLTPRA